jgi:hypothetical protein
MKMFNYCSLLIFILSVNLIAAGTVDFKSFDLDSTPRDIVWCGSTRDTVFVLSETNSLYRSDDKGFSWKKLNDIMINTGKEQLDPEENEIGKVQEIIISPVDKNLVIFLGTHGINWVSQDCGRKIEALNHGRKIHEFIFHPTERNWVMASAFTICEDFKNEPCRNFKEVFVTKDLGDTWTLLLSYVVQFNWGITGQGHITAGIPKERIIASYNPRGKGDQEQIGWNYKIDFVHSDDFFKSKKIAAHKGNKFLLTDKYVFVAQVADQELQEVLLLVAKSTDKFYNFEIIHLNSGKFSEHSYTFLDTSEDSVFIHINHFGDNSLYGHVYISDIDGIRYSLSLPYNVRSSNDNQCDFEKISGLDGIFMANAIDQDYMHGNYEEIAREGIQDEERMDEKPHHKGGEKTESGADASRNFIKSLITFNKGGNWDELKAPTRDVEGKMFECEESCYLHLHGVSSDYPPYYSVESASGIIIGNGNVGQYLSYESEEVSTFLSRDGGSNWFEVRKGSHIYEIGDHGALIVIANDQHPTDVVYYSWDEGLSWQELTISTEKIVVKNIIIEPSSTALHFVVYGETLSKKGKKRGVVVGLNFQSLNERRCNNPEEPDSKESDYEKWSPTDGRDGHQCLMGKKSYYVRRKRESDCYNGQEFDRKMFVEHCTCTTYDYECEEGFSRPNHSESCSPINVETHKIPIEGEVHKPPENCHGYFTISKGYRKVPGNSCLNGVKFDPIIVPCPYSGFFSSLGIIFFILILLILFGLVFLAFNNSFVDKVKDIVEQNKSSSGSKGDDKKKNTKYIDIVIFISIYNFFLIYIFNFL